MYMRFRDRSRPHNLNPVPELIPERGVAVGVSPVSDHCPCCRCDSRVPSVSHRLARLRLKPPASPANPALGRRRPSTAPRSQRYSQTVRGLGAARIVLDRGLGAARIVLDPKPGRMLARARRPLVPAQAHMQPDDAGSGSPAPAGALGAEALAGPIGDDRYDPLAPAGLGGLAQRRRRVAADQSGFDPESMTAEGIHGRVGRMQRPRSLNRWCRRLIRLCLPRSVSLRGCALFRRECIHAERHYVGAMLSIQMLAVLRTMIKVEGIKNA